MKISFYTRTRSTESKEDWSSDTHYGYGKSFVEIKKAFERYSYLGEKLEVRWNDPDCKVQVYFGFEPEKHSHFDHQYKIFMSHNESSIMPKSRVDAFSHADEFWTGNDWSKRAAISGGMKEDKVFIYNLGINPLSYKPVLRGKKDKIRFLHVGSGWIRKRHDLVIQAFETLYQKYGDRIALTIKDSDAQNPFAIHNWMQDFVLRNAGEKIAPGIRMIEETISDREMVSLFNFHDVLVYPSEGEGFGLIPLEAMASGMPVISTKEWCSYSKYLAGNALESDFGNPEVDWGYEMAGSVIRAKPESLIFRMEEAINNIDEISLNYYNQSSKISGEYSWDRVTKKFLDERIPNIGIDLFK